MSEFKPGTVAVATVRGVEGVRVFRRGLNDGRCDWAHDSVAVGYSCSNDPDVTDVRPLVVLDLDLTVVTEKLGAQRNEPQRLVDMLRETADNFFTPDAATLARRVADQIEAQTKPPRIPEPGKWGVVEATHPHARVRCDLVRHENGWFVPGLKPVPWGDLIDPVLVREGVSND